MNAPELHVMEAMQGKAVGLWVMPLEVLRADQLVALRGLGVLRHRAPVGHAPVGTRVPVWKKKPPKFCQKSRAAATIDLKTRATGSLSRTPRGTRVARGFSRESHRTPGTDVQGEMGEVKLPEDVKEQLEKFEAAVQEMEEGLTPLLSADRKEMEAALNPLERARVHIALANAVSTLYASE